MLCLFQIKTDFCVFKLHLTFIVRQTAVEILSMYNYFYNYTFTFSYLSDLILLIMLLFLFKYLYFKSVYSVVNSFVMYFFGFNDFPGCIKFYFIT